MNPPDFFSLVKSCVLAAGLALLHAVCCSPKKAAGERKRTSIVTWLAGMFPPNCSLLCVRFEMIHPALPLLCCFCVSLWVCAAQTWVQFHNHLPIHPPVISGVPVTEPMMNGSYSNKALMAHWEFIWHRDALSTSIAFLTARQELDLGCWRALPQWGLSKLPSECPVTTKNYYY